MSDPEDINPYAAPQSQTLLTQPTNDQPRRPASVKWVLVLMFIAVIDVVHNHASYFLRYGSGLWTIYPWETAFGLLKCVTIFALLIGGQTPSVFWTTLVTLMAMLYSGVATFLREPTDIQISEKVGAYCALFLYLYLLHRFTFGQPSRLYFGIPLRWSVR